MSSHTGCAEHSCSLRPFHLSCVLVKQTAGIRPCFPYSDASCLHPICQKYRLTNISLHVKIRIVADMRLWRNWHTRTFEGRVLNRVRVQVSLAALKTLIPSRNQGFSHIQIDYCFCDRIKGGCYCGTAGWSSQRRAQDP